MQSISYTSLHQASRRLRLRYWDVIDFIHSGRLRARLLGKHWWVERQSLNALARQRERPAA